VEYSCTGDRGRKPEVWTKSCYHNEPNANKHHCAHPHYANWLNAYFIEQLTIVAWITLNPYRLSHTRVYLQSNCGQSSHISYQISEATKTSYLLKLWVIAFVFLPHVMSSSFFKKKCISIQSHLLVHVFHFRFQPQSSQATCENPGANTLRCSHIDARLANISLLDLQLGLRQSQCILTKRFFNASHQTVNGENMNNLRLFAGDWSFCEIISGGTHYLLTY